MGERKRMWCGGRSKKRRNGESAMVRSHTAKRQSSTGRRKRRQGALDQGKDRIHGEQRRVVRHGTPQMRKANNLTQQEKEERSDNNQPRTETVRGGKKYYNILVLE
jgi:hypothetical protein